MPSVRERGAPPERRNEGVPPMSSTAPAPPRVLVLRHARAGRPGLIGEVLGARGVAVDLRFPVEGDALPASSDEFDGLVVMGGFMSANADDVCPHFPALLDLMRACAAEARPVLGVCLGAQLVARAWGGAVHEGRAKEFGYHPLRRTAEAAADPLAAALPERCHVMQWHADTFDLPLGATLLLRGDDGLNQALRIGEVVYGFQCHLEVTEAMLRDWSTEEAHATGSDPATLMAGIEAQYAKYGTVAADAARKLAGRWLDLVETTARRRRENAR